MFVAAKNKMGSRDSSTARRMKRIKLEKTERKDEWKVPLAYLLAYASYEYCDVRSWDNIVQLTRNWSKCFGTINYLKVSAGLALFGLEAMSSSSFWYEGGLKIDGLSSVTVMELLSATR